MYLRRLLVVAVAAPVVSAALVSLAVTSEASVGVGVQAGPVLLASAAHPGGSYALPPVYVVNTGTQPEVVSVRIDRLSAGRGRPVPPSWIHAGPSVRLTAHQAARISLQLVVPAGARTGAYLSDVVAAGSGTISEGNANLGVAAATKLEFRVAPGPVSARLWPAVPAWLEWAAGGLLLFAIAFLGLRRSGWRIRIERTAAEPGFTDRQEGTP
jgi:hypothetical protein